MASRRPARSVGKGSQGRLLCWPRRLRLNPYFERVSHGLAARGWRVDDFAFLKAMVGRYDVLHVHFPAYPFRNPLLPLVLLRLCLTLCAVGLLRLRGCRVVWTVHNLVDHERHWPGLEAAFMRWFSGHLDLSIHLSEFGRSAAFRRYPALVRRPFVVIPHMHYGEDRRDDAASPSHARERLGLEPRAKVILAAGQIRRYKNIPALIRAFQQSPGDDVRLVIAGAIRDRDLEAEIRGAVTDRRVLLTLGALSEERLGLHLAAATLVVAPYRDILNSGNALLALTHRRPILVPDLGAMAELHHKVGASWIRLYQPPLTAEALQAALAWAAEERLQPPRLEEFSPEAVIDAHARAFGALRQRSIPVVAGSGAAAI